MLINLIAVGTKMPDWVKAGFADYAKRLPSDYPLNLIEIKAEPRGKNADTKRILEREGQLIQAAIPKHNHVIALDRLGHAVDTIKISQALQNWHDMNQDISLLIGGPEGLARPCIDQAHTTWSLSKLTLPHPLVRVLVAEQFYRAWSILCHHPYHR